MRKRKITKNQYLEYITAHPYCRIQDIAEHFGEKKSLVASHLVAYGIRLSEIFPPNHNGISLEEIREYAAEHTMKETVVHFGSSSLMGFLYRHNIPCKKKVYPEYHRGNRRPKKCTGTDFEMMYVLSRWFNLACIADVFGVSKEWVRQVCDDFDSGKRVLTAKESND